MSADNQTSPEDKLRTTVIDIICKAKESKVSAYHAWFGIKALLAQAEARGRIDELNNIPYSLETNPHLNRRLASLKDMEKQG